MLCLWWFQTLTCSGYKYKNKGVKSLWMLSLEVCKKVLNKGKNKFTKEQIEEIRKNLYQLADIELKIREENLISYEK